MKNILVVDDDVSFNLMLKTFLGRYYNTDSALKGKEGITKLKNGNVDLLITDLRLPDIYGLDLLKEVKKVDKCPPVILMTSYADIRSAVEAMKLGATDYITKPVNPEVLLAIVKSAIEKEEKNDTIAASGQQYIESISNSSKEIVEHVNIIAPTEMSVIVNGESGTGKEYISRLIHARSSRKSGPFVAVDCGALPRDIAGSELFGHVKGAFTGALKDKKGYFELANGGTIFLDEIGNLAYDIQVQLLRAIQERCVRRLGDDRDITLDVRILVATNENLISAVDKGDFREDLYHRLNEFKITIPALRERREDILFYA
ncbi:MAG: sigma-54 dependent transcriptional regulator, partial [Bacteroidota bacterium]